MRPIIILFTALLMAQSQPASTKDVCRAKRDLWMAEHMDQTNGPMDTKLSAVELSSRMDELSRCGTDVDTGNLHSYSMLSENYESTLMIRYSRFLERHHLMKRFQAEDAAGQR